MPATWPRPSSARSRSSRPSICPSIDPSSTPSFTSSPPSPPTRSTRSSPSSIFSPAISSKPQPEIPLSGLRNELKNESYVYQGYYCSPSRWDSPLQPVIARLERTANFMPGDDPGQKLAKLEPLLAQSEGNIDQSVRLIASLLSIPGNERYPPVEMTPHQQREQTLA